MLATDVVKKFSIKVKTINFIRNNANAIFRVTDTQDKKYCLRIHPADYNTKDAILEELKWLNIIRETTDIPVAKPIYTNEGKYIAEQVHTGISGIRYCDMLEWLDGKFLWKGINKEYAYNLGLLMARLQSHGKKAPIKQRCDYWDADALVGTEKARCKNVECLSGISRDQQKIIASARRCAYEKLKEYQTAHPEKSGLIHGDLNPNNVIIKNNQYGAIDFDDCGIGLYGVDLATPLIAFEHLAEDEGKNFNELKEALFLGYSEFMPLTQIDIDISPYFMLALKLYSVGWLELKKDNPRLRPWFLKCVERTIYFFESNKWENRL
jgi:Ser/Thr protein kinase RdoA (MazF antagonist)